MIYPCATSSAIETWEAPCFTNLEKNRLAFPACVPSIVWFFILPAERFVQPRRFRRLWIEHAIQSGQEQVGFREAVQRLELLVDRQSDLSSVNS